ncbi:CotH kinase family protein [Actinoplanes sp. NPDC026619]|uniref:CotH kinase family protein n=1 Tax=Actinoplanes sp. NPDC026619 TaxID=3155798 RepID=UPI0033D1A0DC
MALKHRIPVRIRHYWKLLATCAAVLLTFGVLFSTVRVAPLVTSASDKSADEVTQNIKSSTDLFDATRAHSIGLTFRDADYQRLLDSYFKDGDKDWLEADLTVDGVTIPSVGIRLKGNSTLGQLTRNGKAREGGRGGPGGGGQRPQMPGGGAAPQMPGGGGFGGFGVGGSGLKAEEPENLPWLIRFDEFVEGRRYEGHREVTMRVSGMGGGKTVMNEAVSLNVLAAAGEAAQRYAYTSFTVNDRPTVARLVVEHPDENFADRIGRSGVLYKSLATSSFTDQGDDQTDYADDFKQINMIGSQDLEPVIKLIRWVNTAGDAEFDQHLAEHVDVESFARYVAEQNLLLNFDDMAGPGKNYYLYYDLGTKKFQVVGWDYNLTLTGEAEQDPTQTVTMGGRGFGGGGQGGLPDGMQLPEGMQPNNAGGGGRGMGGFGGNKLKERFLASSAFQQIYQEAYQDEYRKIYASGAATKALDAALTVLDDVKGYDQAAGATEADGLRTLIDQRTKFLAGTATVKG